jgi:hypothetical protein
MMWILANHDQDEIRKEASGVEHHTGVSDVTESLDEEDESAKDDIECL